MESARNAARSGLINLVIGLILIVAAVVFAASASVNWFMVVLLGLGLVLALGGVAQISTARRPK